MVLAVDAEICRTSWTISQVFFIMSFLFGKRPGCPMEYTHMDIMLLVFSVFVFSKIKLVVLYRESILDQILPYCYIIWWCPQSCYFVNYCWSLNDCHMVTTQGKKCIVCTLDSDERRETFVDINRVMKRYETLL